MDKLNQELDLLLLPLSDYLLKSKYVSIPAPPAIIDCPEYWEEVKDRAIVIDPSMMFSCKVRCPFCSNYTTKYRMSLLADRFNGAIRCTGCNKITSYSEFSEILNPATVTKNDPGRNYTFLEAYVEAFYRITVPHIHRICLATAKDIKLR